MACERDEAALAHVCPVFRASVPAAHATRGSTHSDASRHGMRSARPVLRVPLPPGGGAAFRNGGLGRMLQHLAALLRRGPLVRASCDRARVAGVPTAIARLISPTWCTGCSVRPQLLSAPVWSSRSASRLCATGPFRSSACSAGARKRRACAGGERARCMRHRTRALTRRTGAPGTRKGRGRAPAGVQEVVRLA